MPHLFLFMGLGGFRCVDFFRAKFCHKISHAVFQMSPQTRNYAAAFSLLGVWDRFRSRAVLTQLDISFGNVFPLLGIQGEGVWSDPSIWLYFFALRNKALF